MNIMVTFVIKIKKSLKSDFQLYNLISTRISIFKLTRNLLKRNILLCLGTKGTSQVLFILLLCFFVRFSPPFNHCSVCSHCRPWVSCMGFCLQLHHQGSCPQDPLSNSDQHSADGIRSLTLSHLPGYRLQWRDCIAGTKE